LPPGQALAHFLLDMLPFLLHLCHLSSLASTDLEESPAIDAGKKQTY
jgi:hypothetical protein